MSKFKGPVCKGDWAIGNNCQICERCVATRPTATAPVGAGEVAERVLAIPYAFATSRTSAPEMIDRQAAATAIISAAITAAEQRGAERERGNVVAWLREYGNVHCGEDMAISAMRDAGPSFANAIETGAHDG